MLFVQNKTKYCTNKETQQANYRYEGNIASKLCELLTESIRQKGCNFYGNFFNLLDFFNLYFRFILASSNILHKTWSRVMNTSNNFFTNFSFVNFIRNLTQIIYESNQMLTSF